MKLSSPLHQKKARIEIIPLIDVMFFLLASFMMVSLTMIHLRSVKMPLPTAAAAKSMNKPDMIELSVNQVGDVLVDGKTRIPLPDLSRLVSQRVSANTNVSVYMTGDPVVSHGRMMELVDWIRGLGVKRISFNIGIDDTITSQKR